MKERNVCLFVREREREMESNVCVRERMTEMKERIREVCVRDKERENLCVSER
jgi:hypothetical protein